LVIIANILPNIIMLHKVTRIYSIVKGKNMKKLLFIASLLPGIALADVVVVGTTPRYVTIYQKQCEVKDIFIQKSSSSTLVGGVIGGLLGHQVGNGSGKTAATIAGAIIGSDIANKNSEPKLIQREYCTEVPIQVQKGETVTFEYKGRIFRQTFDN